MLKIILSMITVFTAVFPSHGDDLLLKAFPPGEEKYLPIQKNEKLFFDLKRPVGKNESVMLEFDARIDYPSVGGHAAQAMALFVNGKAVPAANLVSCPIEFRRANGDTGEQGRWDAPRWNFNTVKTGDPYADELLKFGGDKYGLVYAENFDLIDSSRNPYRSPGYSRKHLVFDITGFCKSNAVNELVFRNTLLPGFTKLMGSKSELPLVFRNVTVRITGEKAVKPRPFWLQEIAEDCRKMPFVTPEKRWREDYNLDVDDNGQLSIRTGDRTYVLKSQFSFPGNGGHNGFPSTRNAEPEWKVAKKEKDGIFQLSAEGKFYKVERRIIRHDYFIEVLDTLENLTDKPEGVIVQYEIPFQWSVDRGNSIYLSGLKILERIVTMRYFPENPTVFIQDPSGSIGMTPFDDVFRIHCMSYAVNDSIQLRDSQLVLGPKKKYTLCLQLFPVAKGDYWDFINHLRHAWNLNGVTVSGEYGVLLSPVSPGRKIRPSIKSIHVPNNFQGRTYWGYALRNNEPMHKHMKEIITSAKKALPSDVRVYANYMAPYFSNATGDDLKLFKDSVVTKKDGSYPMEDGCRFFIPTRDNSFGRMVTEMIDIMLDDWKADGIYFDYMEGADPYFTYNARDGYSGDIDEKTGKLIAEKGSYQLLSQDFLIWLVKRIHSKGGRVHANRGNFTWTTTRELKELVPFRWAECGYPDQLTRGHLTPCPLGLQRTFSNKLHLQLIRALYEGMMTSPYDVAYPWADNPIAKIFPFTYMEMHRGYAIGQERIVTAVSGCFGWGDKSEITCSLFDSEGRPKPNHFKMIQRDNQNFMKVELQPLEVAVLVRKSSSGPK